MLVFLGKGVRGPLGAIYTLLVAEGKEGPGRSAGALFLACAAAPEAGPTCVGPALHLMLLVYYFFSLKEATSGS